MASSLPFFAGVKSASRMPFSERNGELAAIFPLYKGRGGML